MQTDYDKYIDAKGLKCPQPLLLVKKAFMQMQVGETLKIEATDPHTDLDLQVWCERFGHNLCESETIQNTYVFFIEKK